MDKTPVCLPSTPLQTSKAYPQVEKTGKHDVFLQFCFLFHTAKIINLSKKSMPYLQGLRIVRRPMPSTEELNCAGPGNGRYNRKKPQIEPETNNGLDDMEIFEYDK